MDVINLLLNGCFIAWISDIVYYRGYSWDTWQFWAIYMTGLLFLIFINKPTKD